MRVCSIRDGWVRLGVLIHVIAAHAIIMAGSGCITAQRSADSAGKRYFCFCSSGRHFTSSLASNGLRPGVNGGVGISPARPRRCATVSDG